MLKSEDFRGALKAGGICSLIAPFLILTLIWGITIWIINPVGEFMVNDDWAFTKAFESLSHDGTFSSTGWGPANAPGGPALIAHLAWAWVFTKLLGPSLTTLRISVLTLGVVGSMAMLVLLRLAGASARTAFWGTLILVFNPLYLSQCFTFMTDITFTCFALLSLLFLHLGVVRLHTGLLIVGLLFSLCSILTRQIGLVIPLGFLLVCALHPRGVLIGRIRSLLLVVLCTMVPWIVYEIVLAGVGSTPITQHQVIHKIIGYPLEMGLSQYLLSRLAPLALAALGYCSFLISPALALHVGRCWQWKTFRWFAVFVLCLLLAGETLSALGLYDFPVILHRNVLYNFGIGPVLLRDTYILGIARTVTIPKAIYLVIVAWTALCAFMFIGLAGSSLRAFRHADEGSADDARGFFSALALGSGLIYLAIILLTGFHDRYLILPCALFIAWLLANHPRENDFQLDEPRFALAVTPLLFMAALALFGTADFMAMKRALHNAQDYVVAQLGVNPCQMDGGFEFNGYHCYDKDFKAEKGKSWWWVRQEDAVLTLGPLHGYKTVRQFPFTRHLGPNGMVCVLRPTPARSGSNAPRD